MSTPHENLIRYLLQKGTGIVPTAEQLDIVTCAGSMQGDDTLTIRAFAGAAKTSTLEMLAAAFPQCKFLYLAFNRAIVEDAKKKFPPNVEVRTTHSFAYRYTAIGHTVRNGNYRAAEIAKMFSVDYSLAEIGLRVFEFFCNSAVSSFEYIAADIEGINIAEKLYGKMLAKEIDITHSFYLKEFQLFLKGDGRVANTYNYILLDEAQDTNNVTLSLFNHLPGKKIKVGDGHQSCYAFRGAINAMGDDTTVSKKQKERGGHQRRLTVTFRCRPEIVQHANWILDTFKGEKVKIVSGNNRDSEIRDAAIITRTNSSLIDFMDDIPGFNLTRAPELLFDCVLSLLSWKYRQYSAISKPYSFLTQFRDEGEILKYIEEAQDQELKMGLKLLEKYDSPEWTSKGFPFGEKIRDFYRKAVKYYAKNGSFQVTLSTAHSIKGLEFDRAVLGEDFPDIAGGIQKLIVADLIKTEEDFLKSQKYEVVAMREEANLYYIAVTRARYELQDFSKNLELYRRKATLGDVFKFRT